MCFLREKKRIIGYNNIDNNENNNTYYIGNNNNENNDDDIDINWTKSCGLGVGCIACHVKYQI